MAPRPAASAWKRGHASPHEHGAMNRPASPRAFLLYTALAVAGALAVTSAMLLISRLLPRPW